METSQLESAFMKAHQAGDTAVASVLAAEIKRMRAPAQPAEPAYQGNAGSGGVMGGVWQGIKDPFAALHQMVARGANKIGLIDDAEVARIDQMTKDEVGQYEADRKAAGRSGFDAARMGGNVIGASPLLMVPGANTVGGAAAIGAVSGMLQPTIEGDFWAEKAKQAALGGATGAAGGAIAKGVSRFISPKTSADAAALMREGVDLTPGQIAGGMLKKAEDSATSIPLAGSMIDRAKAKSIESFNRATYNKVLSPVGDALPDGIGGREAAKYAHKALSDRYDSILSQMPTTVDQQFGAQARFIGQKIGSLPESNAAQFSRIVKDNLVRHFDANGNMTGEQMKMSVSELGRLGADYKGGPSPGDRQMGDLILKLQGAVKDLAARRNPQLAGELKNVDKAWAMYTRTRTAASSLGAEDGVFTPAQLLNAVKASDKSGSKAAFSKGDALLQDWAEMGKKVLPSKVGDSGTAGRAGIGALLTGGLGVIDPVTTGLSIGGISAAYSGLGQKALGALLSKRPAGAATLADLISRGAPLPLTAGGYRLLQE